MKNWRTSLAGIIGGVFLIIKGWLIKDTNVIVAGVGIVVTGIVAKDADNEEVIK